MKPMTNDRGGPTGMGGRRAETGAVAAAIAGLALQASMLAAPGSAHAATYPTMAPIAQYQMASQAEEIRVARSAAPPSISADADVLTLGAAGYETAVKGHNGWSCIVERSWAAGIDDPEFWNPKIRGPICFNPASVRSVLPTYLERTGWVLAGESRARIIERTKASIAVGRIRPPEAGAMCYMMSKDGYLGDGAGGYWHPHLMFFLPHEVGGAAAWGANLAGSPVKGGEADLDPAVVYFVIVSKWSDGTSADMVM